MGLGHDTCAHPKRCGLRQATKIQALLTMKGRNVQGISTGFLLQLSTGLRESFEAEGGRERGGEYSALHIPPEVKRLPEAQPAGIRGQAAPCRGGNQFLEEMAALAQSS